MTPRGKIPLNLMFSIEYLLSHNSSGVSDQEAIHEEDESQPLPIQFESFYHAEFSSISDFDVTSRKCKLQYLRNCFQVNFNIL